MGRPLRIEGAGMFRHLMARGVERRRIFLDDEDYQTYMRLLATTVVHHRWRLLTFCLMPNHVHLVIETTAPNIRNGMHWLQQNYSKAFNRRYAREGYLYQGRYRAPLPIEDPGAFVRTIGYVVTNANRAALCPTPADWPWGAHALVASGRPPRWLAHERLLELLDDMVGFDCYDELIVTYGQSALLTRTS